MDIAHGIVTRMPLIELWRADGFTTTARLRDLKAEDIADLLRAGRVQFVVVNLGHKLNWIPLGECFDFWNSKVRPHLAESGAWFRPEAFPGEYCYSASEWADIEGRPPIVALEMSH